MAYIGIDFGTSNSVVANFQYGKAEVVPNREGQKWTPSVVTLRRDGTLAFGQEAKENFDEQRSIRSIKRILGTSQRVPLIGQNLRTEQTAAAICYGLNADEDQTVLVYDFGGGTLDVTILKIHHGIFEEISSKGIGRLGGDDIDLALAKVLAERFQQKTGFDVLNSPYRQQFMLAVERAKIDLSGERTAVARKAELVPERHLSLEEEVERGEFEKIIMPLVVRSG